jgi:hypothetical protein
LDYVDQQLQQIQQNQPDLWNQMKKQQGFGATIAGDRGVMEYYLSGVQPKLSTHETKSQAQLDTESVQLQKLTQDVKNQPIENADKHRLIEAQISNLNRKNQEPTNAPAEYAQGNMYDIEVPLSSGKIAQLSAAPLGKNMKLSIGDNQAIVTDIAKSKKSGDIWAKVLVNDKDQFLLDENNLSGAKQTWRKVKNPEIFQKTINRTIQAGGFAKKEIPYAQALVNGVFNSKSQQLSSMKGVSAATPNPATPPKLPPITSTVTYTKKQLTDQGYSDKEIQDIVASKRTEGIEIIIK